MKNKRVICCIILVLQLSCLYSQNNIINSRDWLVNSSSNIDFLVIEYFNQSNLTVKKEIIIKVSKRKDNDFRLIMENIFYNKDINNFEREFLLYLSLHYCIYDSQTAEKNSSIFKTYLENIYTYRDSLLRKEIIKKLDYLNPSEAEKIILKEADLLLAFSRKNSSFSQELLEESRIFINQAGKYNSIPVRESVISLYNNVDNMPAYYLKQ